MTPAELPHGRKYSLLDSRSYRWVQLVDDEYSLTRLPAFRTTFRWPDPKVWYESVGFNDFKKAWAAAEQNAGSPPLVVMED